MPLDSDYDYDNISYCPVCGKLEERGCGCTKEEKDEWQKGYDKYLKRRINNG